MRVIAGELRGRIIAAPAGRTVRPTSDRVRESLFDLLGPVADRARVLDLFAGTGALGIEALSRGAGHATFVEADARVRRVLARNLNGLGLRGRSRIRTADAASPSGVRGGPFELVLADPPYGGCDLAVLVRQVGEVLAGRGGVLALEHAASEGPPEPPETLALWKARRYGGTGIALYVRSGEKEDRE